MKYESVFLSASSVKEADGRSSLYGVSTFELMGNAGKKLFECINDNGVSTERAVIVCGRGGNGGDGYSLCVAMQKEGIAPTAIYVAPPKNADSSEYLRIFTENGGKTIRFSDDTEYTASILENATVIVDALHGIAFAGELRGEELALVDMINGSEAFVVSADIPTGISADGHVSGNPVIADCTVTFTANKAATVSEPSLGFCGKIYVADIGVPEEALANIRPEGVITDESILGYLPKRPRNSNKGTFGTLLAVVGSPDMPGAAYLAVNGALRSGVGLVGICSDTETLGVLKNRLSEPVFIPIENPIECERRHTACLIGPGIGRSKDKYLDDILKKQTQVTVIDADGINYLASHINVLMEMQGDVILTPHPGEMARLIGKDIEYVNNNRIECARAFAMEYCLVVVLKGDRTVIASPNGDVFINTTGNSGLAKGGSGDVLAGVIASLSAQGVTPLKAACIGAYVHGLAAEHLSEIYGVHGVLPHDLPEEIGSILG